MKTTPFSSRSDELAFARRHKLRFLAVAVICSAAAGYGVSAIADRSSSPAPVIAHFSGTSTNGVRAVVGSFRVATHEMLSLTWNEQVHSNSNIAAPSGRRGPLAFYLVDAAGNVEPLGAIPVFTDETDVAGSTSGVFGRDIVDGQYISPLNSRALMRGSVGVPLTPGTYRLEAAADGPWNATISGLEDEGATPLPETLSGSWPEVIGPFAMPTLFRVIGTNHAAGSGTFDVEVFSASTGDFVSTAMVAEGSVTDLSSSVAVATPGSYYLGVLSDGSWTVEVDS